MTDLNALAERLAQATEPDRELDAEIWLTCVPGTTRNALRVDHPKGPYVIDETRELQSDGSRRLVTIPSYTASLDAALTLVPAGWNVREADSNGGRWTFVLGFGDDNHPAYRETWSWPGVDRERAIFHRKPPALALCIAALRSRATKGTQDE